MQRNSSIMGENELTQQTEKYYPIPLGKDPGGNELFYKYVPYESIHILEQAITRSGKSNLAEGMIKGFIELPVEVRPNIVVIDSEQEFGRLRYYDDSFIIVGEGGEIPIVLDQAREFGKQVRINRLNVVIRITSIFDVDERYEYLSNFIRGLLDAEQKFWKPMVFFCDEVQKYANSSLRSPSKGALSTLTETGLKRGILCLYLTQGVKDLFTQIRKQCLPPTELIITDKGLKQISDIKIGDLVYTHKGRYRKVTHLFKKEHNGFVYKIYSRGCNIPTITTEEHPFYTSKQKIEWKGRHLIIKKHYPEKYWKKAKDLSLKDSLVFPRISETSDIDKKEIIYRYERSLRNGKKESREIKKIIEINKDLMFVAGLYLAEGSLSYQISRTKNRDYKHLSRNWIRFSFGKSEKERELAVILVNSLKRLGFHSHMRRGTEQQNYCFIVECKSVILGKWLEENFSFNSDAKKISRDIKELSSEKLLWLLEGYLMGDGYHVPKKEKFTATTASKQLAYDIRDVALKTGFNGYVFEYVVKTENAFKRKKTITSNVNVIQIVLNKKSHGSIPSDNENMYLRIKKIEKIKYDGLVYNIEVEEDNSYCTRSCVIHNCTNRIVGFTDDRGDCELICEELLMMPKDDWQKLRELQKTKGTFYARGFDICEDTRMFSAKDMGWKTFDEKYLNYPKLNQETKKLALSLGNDLNVASTDVVSFLRGKIQKLEIEIDHLKTTQITDDLIRQIKSDTRLQTWDEANRSIMKELVSWEKEIQDRSKFSLFKRKTIVIIFERLVDGTIAKAVRFR